MPLIDKLLWGLTTALATLTLARLVQQQLVPRYRAFAAMLAITILRDVLLMLVPYSTHRYAQAWLLSLPVLLGVHVWVAAAAYQAIARIYPGIGLFAVKLFAGCLIAAGIGCAALLPLEIKRIGGLEAQLRCAFLAYRWIDSVAAGGLILAVLFLSRFPAPLKLVPKNLRWHTALLTGYFGAYGATCLIENVAPLGSVMLIERIHFGFIALLYAVWCAFKAAGERSELWPLIDSQTKSYLDQRDAAARAFFAGQ